MNKAKEQYYSIAFEYERAKRGGNNSSNPSSTSTSQENPSSSLAHSAFNSFSSRHLDRIERKYRQAQDEYKLTIEKYNLIRNDYEKRFSDGKTKLHHSHRILLVRSFIEIPILRNRSYRKNARLFIEFLRSTSTN